MSVKLTRRWRAFLPRVLTKSDLNIEDSERVRRLPPPIEHGGGLFAVRGRGLKGVPICRLDANLRAMTDRIDSERRSENMRRVRSAHTRPEMTVRRAAHGMGYRFRLNRRDLPGTPDLVFPSRRSVIFVHGCFWHRHEGCSRTTTPATRRRFWAAKFTENRARDRRVSAELIERGWRVCVIWECETKKVESLASRIVEFLGAPKCACG